MSAPLESSIDERPMKSQHLNMRYDILSKTLNVDLIAGNIKELVVADPGE